MNQSGLRGSPWVQGWIWHFEEATVAIVHRVLLSLQLRTVHDMSAHKLAKGRKRLTGNIWEEKVSEFTKIKKKAGNSSH